MRERSFQALSPSGFHRVSYVEWGLADSPRTLLCVHGLTRNGRDFDILAEALARRGWRVVCPDVVGRGRSGRLADPRNYGLPQYAADMAALIARLDVERVDWLGTSMGGLIGLALAATPGAPIARLVVNDVGPFVPKAALQRIDGYLRQRESFATPLEAEAQLRRIHAPFGRLTDEQWAAMAAHSFQRNAEGRLEPAWDPRIVVPMPADPVDLNLWPLWDSLRLPTLVLRGAESDLLLAETADEMARRGPRPLVLTFPDCGHAPALMDPDQIAAVAGWLDD